MNQGAGTTPEPMTGLRYGMRALRHRDFRIFLIGATASSSGSFLQNLAVPYVMYDLTKSSLWVGLAGFAQFIPSFLLGPLGGSLADRKDRKSVLLVMQTLLSIAALALWGVWATGHHDRILILGIVAVTGVLSGLVIPSWQAFVPSLVPKEDLASAITLNSTQFNAARAIGPALGGVLLATAGPSWAFFLNGASYVAVIAAIWVVTPLSVQPRKTSVESVRAEFASALRYIQLRPGIGIGIASAMLVGFFGSPIAQFIVVFTEDVYHADATVLGLLAAAIGTGAVLMAPALSAWDGRYRRSDVIRFGLPFYGLATIGFGAAPNWPTGLVALLFMGAGFLAVIATSNTAVQLIVAEEMRGRVMSARVMSFTLAFPMGSLAQGVLGDVIGPQATVMLAGSCLLLFAIYLAVTKVDLLRRLDATDDSLPDRIRS